MVAVVLSDPLVVLETVLVLEGLLVVGVIAWDVVVLAMLETVIADPFVMLIKGASELPMVLELGTAVQGGCVVPLLVVNVVAFVVVKVAVVVVLIVVDGGAVNGFVEVDVAVVILVVEADAVVVVTVVPELPVARVDVEEGLVELVDVVLGKRSQFWNSSYTNITCQTTSLLPTSYWH